MEISMIFVLLSENFSVISCETGFEWSYQMIIQELAQNKCATFQRNKEVKTFISTSQVDMLCHTVK